MFDWDEKKRVKNLEDHKLDFRDAGFVFKSPSKNTETVFRSGEQRFMDYAKVGDRFLVLVYTYRYEKVRIISFRDASRKERSVYYGEVG